MRDLTPFMQNIPAVNAERFGELIMANAELAAELQKAKDSVQLDRSKQGPVFAIGEVLEIRGGRFKVRAIAGSRLYLDSLPAI